MTIREQLESDEDKVLSPFAQKSRLSRAAIVTNQPTTLDLSSSTTAIASALEGVPAPGGQDQVFLAPAGDHYRTRLTHTSEVSQIARTIARPCA